MRDRKKSQSSAGRHLHRPKREAGAPVPQVVLCAGMKSSGSTWLYNVVFEVAKAALWRKRGKRSATHGSKIIQFYADKVSDFPPRAASAAHLVIKTHLPDASLHLLSRFSSAQVFLTVREPRDAIASLMERFHHPFESTLAEVAVGSMRIVDLKHAYNPPVFRFEDRFFDRRETVALIAKMLDLPLSRAEADRIFNRHTRTAVRRRISQFASRGVFGDDPDPDRFHPRSHWHPGHIGTGTMGKFAAILAISQQRSVLAATAKYCRAFGYNDHFAGSLR